MMFIKRLFCSVTLVFLVALAARADEASGSVNWDELNDYEQKVLVDLQDDWHRIPAERQRQLQRGAQRWLHQMIERRSFDRDRYQRWQQLSADERERVRKRFEQFQRFSAEEREQIREAQRRYEALSAEERKAWRERWESLPAEVRAQIEQRRELMDERRGPHGRGDRHHRRPDPRNSSQEKDASQAEQ